MWPFTSDAPPDNTAPFSLPGPVRMPAAAPAAPPQGNPSIMSALLGGEGERGSNMGLLALLTGASMLAANRPGTHFNQALGQGVIGGFGSYGGLQNGQARDSFLNAETAQKNIATASALDTLNRQRAIFGLPPIDARSVSGPGGVARAAVPQIGAAGGTGGTLSGTLGGNGLPNPALLSREEAGAWATRLKAAGLKDWAEPFEKVALEGPISGFENDGRGGLRPIANGPASPEQQTIKALTSKGFALGPDGQWRNPAGSVASQAELAGAIKGAEANAELPAKLAAQKQSSDLAARNDKGMYFDARGNASAVPGYQPIAAGLAGATTGAQKAAEQPFTQANALQTADLQLRNKIAEGIENRGGSEHVFPLGVPGFNAEGRFTGFQRADARPGPRVDNVPGTPGTPATFRNSSETGENEQLAAKARNEASTRAAAAAPAIQRINQAADAAHFADFGSLNAVPNLLSKAGYSLGMKEGESQSANAIVDKLSTLLAADTTSAAGQTANAALEMIRENLPNRSMTKDAVAEMFGTLRGIHEYNQAVAEVRNKAKSNVGIETTPEFKAVDPQSYVDEAVKDVRRRMGLKGESPLTRKAEAGVAPAAGEGKPGPEAEAAHLEQLQAEARRLKAARQAPMRPGTDY